jgi:hypothetical protein
MSGNGFNKDRVLEEIDKVELVPSDGHGESGWVYFVVCPETARCKIGFTKGKVQKRIASLQTGSPSELVLIAMQPGTLETERKLHVRFADSRLHGEWFRLTDQLRAYLIVTVWAMSTATLSNGGKLEPWMHLGIQATLDSLDTISEELAELLERSLP